MFQRHDIYNARRKMYCFKTNEFLLLSVSCVYRCRKIKSNKVFKFVYREKKNHFYVAIINERVP